MSIEGQRMTYFDDNDVFLITTIGLLSPYESGKSVSKEDLIKGIIKYQKKYGVMYFRIHAENNKKMEKLIKKNKYSQLRLTYTIPLSWPFDLSGSQEISDLDTLLQALVFNDSLKEENNKYALSGMSYLYSRAVKLFPGEEEAIIKCFQNTE